MIGLGRSQTASRGRTARSRSGAPGRDPVRPRGGASRIRRRRLPRPGPRLIAALLIVVLVAGGGWLWLRNSSLVSVRHVTITGVSGPDAARIRSALTGAARGMTTLDVKLNALHTAVKPYPVVKHLRVSTSFPHTMRIQVAEQVPVAEISGDGRQIAVAADGTLLHDAPSTGPLPTITASVFPGGTRIDSGLEPEVRLLAAAPYALLGRVGQVSTDSVHGLVAALRNGPRLYFGDASNLAAKWAAAAAVLASSSSAGASYIDVTDASRPAAGAGSDSGASTSAGAATGTPAAGATGANAAGTGTSGTG